MLPFGTTTISVLRSSAADGTDAYPDVEPTYSPIATGIRAVIGTPGGMVVQEGTLREDIAYPLKCDVTDLQHADRIEDESTGPVYTVKWVSQSRGFGLDHMDAELRLVEGFTE
jgi:hypothetical protein